MAQQMVPLLVFWMVRLLARPRVVQLVMLWVSLSVPQWVLQLAWL